MYNSIGRYLKTQFGTRVVKLSLDGGFTCPNRDGTCGTGGCIFCSAGGSGELAGDIPDQIELLSSKWPKAKYIAYFQAHTNTYAPVEELREKYYSALNREVDGEIVGLTVATRPDCLPDDVLNLLSELNEKTFLWIELGLQTSNDETAATINRGYPLSVYDEACEKLASRGIRCVPHLILGLPKRIENPGPNALVTPESREEMFESLRHVCDKKPFGLKLHMLNLVKGSGLATLAPNYLPFESIDEYVNLVCDMLEEIPPEITIHRLNGDVPRKILLAPEWSYKKRTILNGIANEMRRRGSVQGCKLR